MTAFNNLNEPTLRTFPDGSTESTARDAAGRVVSIAGILDEVRYDTRSMLTGMDYANGATTAMTFDAMMRPATLTHSNSTGDALEALAYARDRQGHISGIADTSGRTDVPDATHTLTYDAWYRLTGAQLFGSDGQAEGLRYGFDLLDNTTTITSSLGGASPSHVGAIGYQAQRPNTVASAGELDYAHDAAGQMTKRGASMMEWDHQMRVASVSREGRQATYLYSEGPQQVAVVAHDEVGLYGLHSFELRDGVSQTYYRLNGTRVALKRSTSLMTKVYPDLIDDQEINAADAFAALTVGGAEAAAGLTQAAAPARILGASAARMLAELEDEVSFLHHDHLGSLTLATDARGEARGQRAFYPNGLVRWDRGHVDRYGFTGQEHMDSGLIRFLFRHLDPKVGRWASFDPLFMALSAAQLDSFGEATTGYAYVANNFSNTIDPLGLNGSKHSRGSKKIQRAVAMRLPRGGGGGGSRGSISSYGSSVSFNRPDSGRFRLAPGMSSKERHNKSLTSYQLQQKGRFQSTVVNSLNQRNNAVNANNRGGAGANAARNVPVAPPRLAPAAPQRAPVAPQRNVAQLVDFPSSRSGGSTTSTSSALFTRNEKLAMGAIAGTLVTAVGTVLALEATGTIDIPGN